MCIVTASHKRAAGWSASCFQALAGPQITNQQQPRNICQQHCHPYALLVQVSQPDRLNPPWVSYVHGRPHCRCHRHRPFWFSCSSSEESISWPPGSRPFCSSSVSSLSSPWSSSLSPSSSSPSSSPTALPLPPFFIPWHPLAIFGHSLQDCLNVCYCPMRLQRSWTESWFLAYSCEIWQVWTLL